MEVKKLIHIHLPSATERLLQSRIRQHAEKKGPPPTRDILIALAVRGVFATPLDKYKRSLTAQI